MSGETRLLGTYRGLPIFMWVLLGVLGLAAFTLSLGERDDEAQPAADSFSPSGTSAFAELLRTHGYAVRIDRWPRPRLQPGDVAIACSVAQQVVGQEGSEAPFRPYLESKVRQGVNAIELPLPKDFLQASRTILASTPTAVTPRGGGQSMKLDLAFADGYKSPAPSGAVPDATSTVPSHEGPNVGLWQTQGGAFLRAFQVGKGRILVANDGDFVTNRFIDRADDARAALAMVAMVAPPGAHLIFTEAAFGHVVPPSLMETIGPWAYAGWQQLLFLGVVVVYTLGKRFGIPDEVRPPQRGSRELLDAISDTYMRGRHTQAAMQSALDRTEVQLRSALRVPRGASFTDLARRLPDDLAEALRALRSACQPEVETRPDEALQLILAVRTRADAYIGQRVWITATEERKTMKNLFMSLPLLLGLAIVARSSIAQETELKPGSTDPAVLKRLQKEWGDAGDALAKHPKDPKVRDHYAVAGVRFAYESMYSPLLPPKVRYPQALRIYRKVLAVDPKNKEASQASELIISVYNQMHRPVPK